MITTPNCLGRGGTVIERRSIFYLKNPLCSGDQQLPRHRPQSNEVSFHLFAMSGTALDLQSVGVGSFWEKVVDSNANLKAVVKAAASDTLQIAAADAKLYLNTVGWYGTADVAPWIVGALNVPGINWPCVYGSGSFKISFDSFKFDLSLNDSYGYNIFSVTKQIQVPTPFVGLSANGSWTARSEN
ncbi:hypothetical protein BXZ70DRAFT_563353 [Cristinia sonorae]|uniref:Uncharacterized protein n=1 Tax=Cristinia sonorae TaxID=1940300 RepID=A0A8K0XLD6_9AGAR|nr:hypothetical protein BXZ70DRAFT_563353 [Cristinia sonorae]